MPAYALVTSSEVPSRRDEKMLPPPLLNDRLLKPIVGEMGVIEHNQTNKPSEVRIKTRPGFFNLRNRAFRAESHLEYASP